MALKYKMKRPEGVDALAGAGISTAVELADRADVSRSSAQRVFREEGVALQVAIKVVHALQKDGVDTAVSVMFEEVAA